MPSKRMKRSIKNRRNKARNRNQSGRPGKKFKRRNNQRSSTDDTHALGYDEERQATVRMCNGSRKTPSDVITWRRNPTSFDMDIPEDDVDLPNDLIGRNTTKVKLFMRNEKGKCQPLKFDWNLARMNIHVYRNTKKYYKALFKLNHALRQRMDIGGVIKDFDGVSYLILISPEP